MRIEQCASTWGQTQSAGRHAEEDSAGRSEHVAPCPKALPHAVRVGAASARSRA